MAYRWVSKGPRRIPAVCDDCGTIFDSGFALGPGTSVSMVNNKSGPCPSCGGIGTIQNGVYEAVESALQLILEDLEPGNRRESVRELRTLFERAKSEGMGPSDLAEAIHKQAPAFAALTNILPDTKSEFYEFVTMILAALTLIYAMITSHPDAPAPTSTQIFNTIVSQHPADPPAAASPTAGRNDPCPCGSGKKFKKCHGSAIERQ
jgi:hypothetical protein